ncbi:MAG: hypothetical protein M0R74_01020 [Dehalococcoidia bacterium]|nr:hypothetical protein [Dehalococcoidia bacterium]
MTQERKAPSIITVWRDFEHCRAPKRLRCNNHKRKLAEFLCHLHGQNYFTRPHRVVTLHEWDVTDEAVELWARIRHLIAKVEADEGSVPMQPLFMYADVLDEVIPTHNNLVAARRDLVSAIGMRAALSRSDRESDLQFD